MYEFITFLRGQVNMIRQLNASFAVKQSSLI